MFCLKNLSFLWNYCTSCELLSFNQDSEDGKRSVCEKCARKIVNRYRMFAELHEALVGDRALEEVKDFKRSWPRTPWTTSPSSPIPV